MHSLEGLLGMAADQTILMGCVGHGLFEARDVCSTHPCLGQSQRVGIHHFAVGIVQAECSAPGPAVLQVFVRHKDVVAFARGDELVFGKVDDLGNGFGIEGAKLVIDCQQHRIGYVVDIKGMFIQRVHAVAGAQPRGAFPGLPPRRVVAVVFVCRVGE